MNIAVIVPLKESACGGVLKHLSNILKEWKRNGEHEATCYLPDFLNHSSGFPADVCVYPKTDFWKGFRVLSTRLKQKSHDAALVITARPVDTGNLPTVVMARNAEPLQHADYSMDFWWRFRLWHYRYEHRRAFSRATRVLTLSRYMRTLVTDFGVPEDKVDVVYHGIDSFESFQTGTRPAAAPRIPFLFTAGVLAPYRGLEDLLRAFAHLRARGITPPPLLVAGAPPGGYTRYSESMHRLARKLGIADSVVWAGSLSRSEMIWCFRFCQAFIFTSRAESIANIVLESLGHGCISISCDHAPMTEIYGDAATFYPWGDGQFLADRIAGILGADEAERMKWKERALLRSQDFSWAATANKTADSLQKAVMEYQPK
ncbi:MAG: glycosyltransferase [Candidatus Latescibacterota bacterium]